MSGYGKQGPPWVDLPARTTPILSSELNGLDQAVYDLKTQVQNVKDYCAVGDGVTDDTTAVQAAVTAALTTTQGRLFFPPGTYLISSAITIPFATGWTIEGASRLNTTIKQATSNTPIFKFTSNNTHSWTVRSMKFDYSTVQPSTNTAACPFYFVGNASTSYNINNWLIQDVNFNNCCDCAGGDTTTKWNVFGGKMRDVTVQPTVTRSLVTFTPLAGSGGQPNIGFDHVYVRADTMVGPIINMTAATSCQIDNFEINQSLLGPTILKDQGGGSYIIGALRSEVGTYSAIVGGLFNIPNSQIIADRIIAKTLTVDASSGTPVVFNFTGGAGNTWVKVDEFSLDATVSAGTLLVTNATTATGRCEIGHITGGLPASTHLTDIVNTTSANAVQVLMWNNGRLSADKGDADYTWAFGDENVVSYETTLTAARTVTLPQPDAAGDLFNGLKIRVVRSAGGAFALNINKAPSTLLDSIPSGKVGEIEYTYRRNAWVQTMKVTI